MAAETAVSETFPEIDEIADPDLREKVATTWSEALTESPHDSLESIPYLPKYREYLGEEVLPTHVRQVTRLAIAIADAAAGVYGGDLLDRDTVVAGALLHDVSKVIETPSAGAEPNEIADLLGHPHYGQYLLARAGLPVALQHVALSHSPKTGVGIKTAEALVVWAADVLALNLMTWAHSQALSPSFAASPMGAGE